jgi:hypothetical protein
MLSFKKFLKNRNLKKQNRQQKNKFSQKNQKEQAYI